MNYHQRLLDGLESAIEEKGYAASTIGDIVRHAQVSKRTFYETFADKDECFLASYQKSAKRLLAAVEAAFDDDLPWREQLHATIKVYLSQLQAKPALTRTFFLEIQAAGEPALKARQTVLKGFTAAIQDLVLRLKQKHPKLRELTPAMATAVVGGIDALVLATTATGRASHLLDLEETATELLCRVVGDATGAV